MLYHSFAIISTCSVNDQPEVWQWVLSIIDLGFFGLNFSLSNVAHRRRAALNLAISYSKLLRLCWILLSNSLLRKWRWFLSYHIKVHSYAPEKWQARSKVIDTHSSLDTWIKIMRVTIQWINKWEMENTVFYILPVLIYSKPSATVNASSNTLLAPASCIWYPEIEIELYLGIFCEV